MPCEICIGSEIVAGPFAKFIFQEALTDGHLAGLKFKKGEINYCIKNPKKPFH